MPEEKKKQIPKDVKDELLKKTSEDGHHTLEEAAKKIENKLPTGAPPDKVSVKPPASPPAKPPAKPPEKPPAKPPAKPKK